MSKRARRRRHLALVRWCHKLPTSPARPPTGYYRPTMWTAGAGGALSRAAERVWADIDLRPYAWIWAPRRPW